jgi:adenylate cyclase
MTDRGLRAHLATRGVAEAELIGLTDDAMIGLAGDLQLAKGLDLTVEELAARCSTTPDRVRAVYRTLGLDAEALAGFGEGDVKLLSLLVGSDATFVDVVADELLRVAGTSLRRMAEAVVAAYVQDIETETARGADDLVGLAELNEYASGLVVEFAETLGTMFRHHMWTAIRDQRSGQAGVTARDLIRVGIGFVDLVGFTSSARTMQPNELMALVEDFERRAFELAAQCGGRIVKSIGDEVMIAAPDHETVAAIATALVTGLGGDPTTRPRAGVSAGEVVFRLGDYYGPVVNVAARLAAVAEPGEILTDVNGRGSGRLTLRPAGRRELKGFDRPVEVWSVE